MYKYPYRTSSNHTLTLQLCCATDGGDMAEQRPERSKATADQTVLAGLFDAASPMDQTIISQSRAPTNRLHNSSHQVRLMLQSHPRPKHHPKDATLNTTILHYAPGLPRAASPFSIPPCKRFTRLQPSPAGVPYPRLYIFPSSSLTLLAPSFLPMTIPPHLRPAPIPPHLPHPHATLPPSVHAHHVSSTRPL